MLGLSLAVVTRVIFVSTVSLLLKFSLPLFHIGARGFSFKDLVLILGGLFLIFKSTKEIHHKLESINEGDSSNSNKVALSFSSTIIQILLLDIVFSIDSVITAVGMVKDVSIMITAVVVSTFIMIIFSKKVVDLINAHPTLKC